MSLIRAGAKTRLDKRPSARARLRADLETRGNLETPFSDVAQTERPPREAASVYRESTFDQAGIAAMRLAVLR
jgi:hypothetical protein